VARTGETRNAYSILVGKPEGKRPFGRRRRRWENNIRVFQVEVFRVETACSAVVGYQRFRCPSNLHIPFTSLHPEDGGSMDL